MLQINTDVTVIGGGIAGMEAAISLSELGINVALIEKLDRLGGHAASWACMATDECGRCSACLVEDNIAKIANDPRIQVLTHAQIADVAYDDKNAKVTIEPARGTAKDRISRSDWKLADQTTIESESVVLATGFEPFDPKNHRLLGYGHLPEIFTTADLDDHLHKDDLAGFLPQQKENNRIAFIQCVGSRDRQRGREYCSQFCCKTSIRLVNRLMYLRPDLDITIYYIDLQIMGKEFRSFYDKVKKKVRFIQGVPAEVRVGSDVDHVRVVGIDPKTGLGKEEEYNRIVLAVGMAPDIRNNELAKQFGLAQNEYGFIEASTKEGLVRTENSRVFLAGACAGPSDIPRSRLSAMAAAKRIASGRQNCATSFSTEAKSEATNGQL